MVFVVSAAQSKMLATARSLPREPMNYRQVVMATRTVNIAGLEMISSKQLDSHAARSSHPSLA
jgi:hypothetical protein